MSGKVPTKVPTADGQRKGKRNEKTISVHFNVSIGCKKLNTKLLKEINAGTYMRVFEAPFKYVDIGKPKKLVVLDNCNLPYGRFTAIRAEDVHTLKEMEDFLKHTFKNNQQQLPAYEPLIGEFCVFLYGEVWMRGKCVDKKNNVSFNIRGVDYKNDLQLTKDKIRPYPYNLTVDCFAVDCVLKDLKRPTGKQMRFITEWGLKQNLTIVLDNAESKNFANMSEYYLEVRIKSLMKDLAKAHLV